MKVLVVDDDALVRDFVAAVLDREGHTVVTAGNGLGAVRRAGAEMPDVIVMDVDMPVMGGLKSLVELRRVGCTAPVILMSGRPDYEQAVVAAGETFLGKPFEIAVLLGLVARLGAKPDVP